MIVEVLNDPDEIARATQALSKQPGWSVRPAQPRDGLTPDERYRAFVVDVASRGAKWRAAGSAREKATRLADRLKVGMWVTDAWLYRPEERKDLLLVHVHRKAPQGAGRRLTWFWQHLVPLGVTDTQRSLLVPYAPEGAEGELEEAEGPIKSRALTALQRPDRPASEPPFDSTRHDVRLPVGPRPTRALSARCALWRVALFLLLFAGVLGCGMAIAASSWPWRFLAFLPPVALVWPVGRWVTSNASRPWLFRLGVGAVAVGCPVYLGYLWEDGRPESVTSRLSGILLMLPILVMGTGLWHAVADSWFSRNLHWLLPVLVAPLPFVLPWAGGFLHAVYLEDGFGIPADAVHVPFYWTYFVALKPLGKVVLVTLILLGCLGWARYFDWQLGLTGMVSLLVPLLALLSSLLVAMSALDQVTSAAERAFQDVAEGRRPPAYFGVQGDIVCVRLLEEDAAVHVSPGPVPTGHPVLAFPAEGESIWVWDPDMARGEDSTQHAVRMRAEDVALFPAKNGRCAAG
ncbi:hypothetical protein ACX6XY_25435 [Streptomyces sp. O3]